MKRIIIYAVMLSIAATAVSCGNNNNKKKNETKEVKTESVVPDYKVVENPQVDLDSFPVDADGFHVIFDGKTLNGWRGYGKDYVPPRWIVDDGAIKFMGNNGEDIPKSDKGDLIFTHKFKDFILELEWKVAERGNSGIFYLAQEVTTEKDGKTRYEPIYISCPEYQVLDNANHPDALLGVDGNRKSASLYDMIPAKPQNQKPFGEWNKARITVKKGKVVHNQNDVDVLEYQLWSPEWTEMLKASKFSPEKWPLAFELLNNCGGKKREGYIGLQDHGDDVWYRNIRVKVL